MLKFLLLISADHGHSNRPQMPSDAISPPHCTRTKMKREFLIGWSANRPSFQSAQPVYNWIQFGRSKFRSILSYFLEANPQHCSASISGQSRAKNFSTDIVRKFRVEILYRKPFCTSTTGPVVVLIWCCLLICPQKLLIKMFQTQTVSSSVFFFEVQSSISLGLLNRLCLKHHPAGLNLKLWGSKTQSVI